MFILVAEDDPNMAKILKMYLQKAGYQVMTVADGSAVLPILENQPVDLLVLDWMLPKVSGLELCQDIRLLNLPVKIMMLTAKTTAADELNGLTNGADEYVKKPFDMAVFLMRVKKLLGAKTVLSFDKIELNPTTFRVSKAGVPLKLTKKEYALLKYFLENQNIVLTRTQLLDHVWGLNYDGDIRTVDTHIKRLRQKIGADYIQTCFGTGYSLQVSHA
ncbi:response regulator transcription factor [Agrilactobacillus yilanensis]|uniref:Response regulator transcription factor n=1 Tax=Agrilactobacillus yilanensis TaxID=2485997 RepID=A0ABW4J7Q7_9LACO|nr:response regulator transcription factor [Agrilactobacillus yilanensis]